MKALTTLLLLLPLALLAQQYTLDELVGHGLENSYGMLRSELAYESSRSSLRSATWNLLPEAGVNFGISNDFYNSGPAADLSSQAGFSISKTISLNDDAWFNYKYAKLDAAKAELTRQTSASAYAYSVFTAYLDVLSTQRQLSSLQKNLEIQTRVWEQAQVLNQLGKNTSFDVKESEIAVMNARISILQLENSIAAKRAQLFSLVRMDDAGHELAELVPDNNYSLPELGPEQSNQVKLLKADLKRGELGLTQSFLNYFPRVSLAYNFSRSVSGDNFDFDTYGTNHTLGLNFSYSLWNQFRQGETNKRGDLAQRLAELEIQQQIDEIDRQYATLTQELAYLNRLDELYGEKLAQSESQIRVAEERFRLGLIELLELDKTRVEFINSEIAYNNNRYQILARQEAINNLLSQKIQGKW
ncbi:MAG: TolC family protein [Candidatus Cloacimonetes bacterium]|nr:TolC family protein [Candidatus Cloacimonadota bacterium]MDY0367834.1 TolC family protein [Candidatus Syntrophosphaera sp.]